MGVGDLPGDLLIHSPVGTPSTCRMTRHGENQTGSLWAWNMANKHTREILLTSFIICPIPDVWPAGSQAWNNDQRQPLTDLTMRPLAPTSIKYRQQSHPWLLNSSLRYAYLAVSFLGPLDITLSFAFGTRKNPLGRNFVLIHPCTPTKSSQKDSRS
jgi:hypothetical protein